MLLKLTDFLEFLSTFRLKSPCKETFGPEKNTAKMIKYLLHKRSNMKKCPLKLHKLPLQYV